MLLYFGQYYVIELALDTATQRRSSGRCYGIGVNGTGPFFRDWGTARGPSRPRARATKGPWWPATARILRDRLYRYADLVGTWRGRTVRIPFIYFNK